MIETKFYVLSEEHYREYKTEAQTLGVDLDYYLLEFCQISGPDVHKEGDNWIEVE